MISLADLRARNVQPVWQEAVAVIQELIQTVSAISGHLPDLEHIALIPNGDVVALPGGPVPSDPVRHAAVMLKVLVEGIPTPPELEQFLEKNLTTPPQFDSLAEFSRNLAFFERPGRRSDVERLVGRAAAAEQLTRADEELKRLMEKANEADPKASSDMLDQQPRRPRRVPPALIASVLVVGAIALPAWWWLTRVRASQPAQSAAAPAADAKGGNGGTASKAPAAAPSLLDRTTAAVRSAVSSLVGSDRAPAAATAPAPAEPATAAEKTRARRPRAGSAAKIQAAPIEGGSNGSPAAPATSAEILPMAEDVTAMHEDDPNVYTPSDATVIPPVMVRPALPKDPPPGVPLHQIGTIDVWVDENGDVERVKLLSPANRYQERMLVSAAKMWKFRPAFKDGHPVRYRTRVRLTV
jgi:hypothetical protein